MYKKIFKKQIKIYKKKNKKKKIKKKEKIKYLQFRPYYNLFHANNILSEKTGKSKDTKIKIFISIFFLRFTNFCRSAK